MPKQIVVANKSRVQTIKVNFRQSLIGWAVRPAPPKFYLAIWAFMPARIEFHRECEVYDLPGEKFLRVTYSSARKNLRTKGQLRNNKQKQKYKARNKYKK